MADKKQDQQSLYQRLGGGKHDDRDMPVFDEEEIASQEDREEEEEGSPGGESEGVAVRGEIAVLQNKLNDKHEQLLRTHAEMQNLRRRMDKEMAQTRKFALERFVKELLPVIDSLEKACHHAYSHPDSKEIHDGIELTLKMFVDCLNNLGVEIIDPREDLFNPAYHQAMSAIEKAEVEKNTILEVLQKGYLLNGRLVRPAWVVVAK